MTYIKDVESDQVIRIAVLGDSHGNYDDLEEAIRAINATAVVDFAVHVGDFTNSSYNFEYDQFLASYAKLRVPRFMVIGNHDAIGAGPSLFRKAFGPSNYYFESEHVRFVFWNSVGLENPEEFDVDWLVDVVTNSAKPVILFSHIPLYDQERFHGKTAETLFYILGHPKLQAAVNGHNHVYKLATDGTRLLQTPRTEGGKWVLLEIKPDGFHISESQNETSTWVGFKDL